MNQTKIDWCTHTLNPVVGCTYGCSFCYAKKMNTRFGWIPKWEEPQFFPERLKMLESKTPKIIFMDSMSDIADWKEEWTFKVFDKIRENEQHKYLFLSKRIVEFFAKNDGSAWFYNTLAENLNIYIGSSICRQKDTSLDDEDVSDFLSIEPILEPITIYSQYFLKWVIIGAETGNRKGKVIPKREWIESIVKQCKEANIPVFMKSSLEWIWRDELIQEYPW